MRRLLLAFALLGCASFQNPCSPEVLTAQAASIVAECKARRASECKGYDVLDECPLMQECDSRLDKVGAQCSKQ